MCRLAEPRACHGPRRRGRALARRHTATTRRLVAHIDGMMQATGYSTNASRSPTDIARRLKEKLALAGAPLDAAQARHRCANSCRSNVSLRYAPGVLGDFRRAPACRSTTRLTRFDARVAALRQCRRQALRHHLARPPSAVRSTTTPASSSRSPCAATTACSPAAAASTGMMTLLGAADAYPRRRLLALARPHRGRDREGARA